MEMEMEKTKKKGASDFEMKIRPKEWSKQELANVKAAIKAHQAKRTPEQKLKTQMLAVKCQMEDYINDAKISDKNMISLEAFIDMYLQALNITFKKFANAIDSTDANLKKYLSGDRKFSTDLALKCASFFHTSPGLWMGVYTKNELLALEKEKKQLSKYKKYDYEKVLLSV
jgi:plasmid maintenance system antidote protein VapI